ncbi:uncharacterized protein LOC114931741 [Nylanderia fulva]|uniref:uncharacterized protein LOC114931741 n=1 Tax=Nylanderia fulva TaxID=613905 RepID=UPI0010FAFCE8|nr:uncharacterized protein LOC114931741 [Nylanderia fulva]
MNTKLAKEIENTIKEGRFQFAVKCLNEIMQINSDTNFVFSPSCIYEALLRMYMLIKGSIAMRLNEILSLKNINLIDLTNYCSYNKKKEQWSKIIKKQKDLPDPSCDCYVKCWCKHDIKFYDKAVLHMFGSEINSLDLLLDSDDNMDEVNSVLRQIVNQTKGYIYYPED